MSAVDAAESRRDVRLDREFLLAFADGSVQRRVMSPFALARLESAMRHPAAALRRSVPVAVVAGSVVSR